jgi:hypothetical protein
VDPASTLEKTSRPPAPTSALRTKNLAAATRETGPASAESAEGAAEPAAGRPEGDESVDHEEASVAELDKDPTYQPKDQRPHGVKGS